jgi:uncharacterized damage-inducible protein DinB
MPHKSALLTADYGQVLLESFAVNERLNQLVLENLDQRAWQAKLSGRNVRTIAAIFTHMHNIRLKWLRLSAPHLRLPAQLNRTGCTQKQARSALAESGRRCLKMLGETISGSGRVRQFRRDGWARPWPAGAAMFVYMISHEAHHRGQVCMLAHQIGFPLSTKVMSGMWTWEKLWRECGYSVPH